MNPTTESTTLELELRRLLEETLDAGPGAEGQPVVLDLFSAVIRADARQNGGRISDGVWALALRHASMLPADLIEMLLSGRSPDAQSHGLLNDALKRFPASAPLLRLAAQEAVARGDESAHDLLTRAARADLTPGAVNLAYRLRGKLPVPAGRTVKAALLSSYTIDGVAPFLDLRIRELGLVPEIYLAPFNSWTTEMLAAQSGLRQFAPEIAFLSVAIDDLVPELAGPMNADELEAAGTRALDRVVTAIEGFFAWSDGVLVVHDMHSAYRDPSGVVAGRAAPSRERWIADLNARLDAAVQQHRRGYVLGMNDLMARRSGGAADNPKMRYLASMRLGEQLLPDVSAAYARYIAPLKGLGRKCVVVDLDNTLWGGVVGEDGPHGIRLGHASPGAEYQDFQRYLLSLTKRGVILAIASKNNPDDALEVIRSHPEMILRESDFAALRINWRPKPENVAALAQDLNIGIDSMVFVDDNPDERELMRQLVPQVLTVDLPRDPARYREALESLPQLQSLVVTDEDLARTASYRANREREQVKVTAASLEAYLASLAITVDVTTANETNLARVEQLIHRTNQFNLTTRRYDAGQLAAFASDPSVRLLVAKAGDRFGDHGLVAVTIAKIEGAVCTIDTFLMSCRVIGYGVETALVADLLARARAAGATEAVGEYIETKKNAPAKDFYERHGFTASAPDGDGVIRWRRSLADGGPDVPAFTAVTSDAA